MYIICLQLKAVVGQGFCFHAFTCAATVPWVELCVALLTYHVVNLSPPPLHGLNAQVGCSLTSLSGGRSHAPFCYRRVTSTTTLLGTAFLNQMLLATWCVNAYLYLGLILMVPDSIGNTYFTIGDIRQI